MKITAWTRIVVASIVTLAPLGAKADVQEPSCVPATTEAQSWPIQSIFLHGLFPANCADDEQSCRNASANAKILTAIAVQQRVRIAIPIAPASAKTGIRSWNSRTLPEIEEQARKACGGAELAAKGRTLIGFSNGAIWAAKHLDCKSTAAYDKVFVIGAQGVGGAVDKKCHGRFVEHSPHHFPGLDLNAAIANLDVGQPDLSTAPAADQDPSAKSGRAE